jgi:hypothetical protein
MSKKSHIRDQDNIEQRIHDLTDRLLHDMDLGWLRLTNSFDQSAEGRTICETICDFEYRQATLRWSLVQAATLTDAELELTAIHELSHCLTACVWESLSSKQKDKLFKLNELATENVARCISHLLQRNQ